MFKPKHVYIEKEALDYPLGVELKEKFENMDIPVDILESNRVNFLRGKNVQEKYEIGKRVLVVGVRRTLEFQSCKPSAHYQLPLVTGCIGKCEYCYLNTNLKDKPFTRIYVNIDDVFKKAKKYVQTGKFKPTIFEGSATSDPVPVEPYTHALAQSIEYFGKLPDARFRFVTKFTDVDGLLHLKHNEKTEIRFSINTDTVIESFEHGTPRVKQRIEAARKVIKAGYPVGFLIAPVFIYPNWKEDYLMLIKMLKNYLPDEDLKHPITFEIISHRFTPTAKNHILQVFEQSKLPMDESERTYKYGQFGYGKYVYPKETIAEIKELFEFGLKHLPFPYEIKYII
ncbi:spore photoproduct lyase [Turicibacter sp. TJ11]|uniref:spore photoproduct lyase n=1 Tax=Turicibacter sp. TJ11 TaxID=2806443 RepID=UPI001F2E1D82|nr:spore photoproduct lyase [Turicibacter sp. TJ11]